MHPKTSLPSMTLTSKLTSTFQQVTHKFVKKQNKKKKLQKNKNIKSHLFIFNFYSFFHSLTHYFVVYFCYSCQCGGAQLLTERTARGSSQTVAQPGGLQETQGSNVNERLPSKSLSLCMFTPRFSALTNSYEN